MEIACILFIKIDNTYKFNRKQLRLIIDLCVIQNLTGLAKHLIANMSKYVELLLLQKKNNYLTFICIQYEYP